MSSISVLLGAPPGTPAQAQGEVRGERGPCRRAEKTVAKVSQL